MGGTVVGLSIYFTKAKIDPEGKEAVLMLSTSESSNVPMVITSTGEFHSDPFPKYRNNVFYIRAFTVSLVDFGMNKCRTEIFLQYLWISPL